MRLTNDLSFLIVEVFRSSVIELVVDNIGGEVVLEEEVTGVLTLKMRIVVGVLQTLLDVGGTKASESMVGSNIIIDSANRKNRWISGIVCSV